MITLIAPFFLPWDYELLEGSGWLEFITVFQLPVQCIAHGGWIRHLCILCVQVFQMLHSKPATHLGKNTYIEVGEALMWDVDSWDKGGWEVPQSESADWTPKKVVVVIPIWIWRPENQDIWRYKYQSKSRTSWGQVGRTIASFLCYCSSRPSIGWCPPASGGGNLLYWVLRFKCQRLPEMPSQTHSEMIPNPCTPMAHSNWHKKLAIPEVKMISCRFSPWTHTDS